MHAAERHHAWNAAPGAHDHLSTDLLPQDPVRRTDVVASLRRDRRSLEAEAVLSNRPGGFVNDAVLVFTPRAQREVETGELELEACHMRCEDAQGLLQEFLPGFIAFKHHDRFGVHRSGH